MSFAEAEGLPDEVEERILDLHVKIMDQRASIRALKRQLAEEQQALRDAREEITRWRRSYFTVREKAEPMGGPETWDNKFISRPG